jgi:hypothetical protein
MDEFASEKHEIRFLYSRGEKMMEKTDYQNKIFMNPPPSTRINPIIHAWPDQTRTDLMDAIKEYGFGGVVTNVSWDQEFMENPLNLEDFGRIMEELEAREMRFWIYDEKGYPSGYAGGKTLEGHPELEAKGFYMRRYAAYEPRQISFQLDGESDKIIWAAKYPLDTSTMHESFLIIDRMEPVAFDPDHLECDLKEKEALFVFCVKPAYEGSHCTHNVFSFSRYINIMDPRAVRRFIDLAFEPLLAAFPDAYIRCGGVFTDEPSLQVGYARDYEVWPYALAPWVDGLVEAFENEYGFSILPYLPYLFEGKSNAYPIRIRFYKLVGKLIAAAYSGQLSAWCEAHGSRFSGHYLGEESMTSHVKDYGDNLEVMKAASYPGIDVLCCYPEVYQYNTAKHAQMVARKKGTNGLMAEICPFYNKEVFQKDPIENMTGVIGLLYLSGVRVVHSYFAADYSAYDPIKFANRKGYMNREEARQFNEYTGRLGVMLDGIMNDCNTFVYYGIEDVQAKMRPDHTAFGGPETEADRSTIMITKRVYEAGFDFYYADKDDLVDAEASLIDGLPLISGCVVKTVIVPALDVIYEETFQALLKLQSAGVSVYFLDKLPSYGAKSALSPSDWTAFFQPSSTEKIITHLRSTEDRFTATAEGTMLIKARFLRNGHELYFVDNNSRHGADVTLEHVEADLATLYNPVTGEIKKIRMGEPVFIPSFRGVFIEF